jgi:hypothetical protein
MSYSYDKFLRPLTESDITIKILDNTNDIKFTIDPFVIINASISNNVLIITLKSKSIKIDFSSINEAKLALIRIQDQIDTLIQKVPNLIDKGIKNYVDSLIGNITSVTGPTGPTGPTGANALWHFMDEYSTGVVYDIGDVVTFGGETWYCISYTPLGYGPFGSYINIYWKLIAAKGLTGSADKYYATSSTTFEIPIIDQVISLTTQPNLAYTAVQSVVVYSELPNFYDSDYQEDGAYFIGQIEYYNPETGDMSLVTTFTYGTGTYDFWYLNLSAVVGGTSLIPFSIMSESERNSIISPQIGTHIYQSDNDEGVYVYKSSGWHFAY